MTTPVVLLRTSDDFVFEGQVPGSPIVYMSPTYGGPALSVQVGDESLHMPDGEEATTMRRFLLPDMFHTYIPDPTLSFAFVPKRVGEGVWVWEPQVVKFEVRSVVDGVLEEPSS